MLFITPCLCYAQFTVHFGIHFRLDLSFYSSSSVFCVAESNQLIRQELTRDDTRETSPKVLNLKLPSS